MKLPDEASLKQIIGHEFPGGDYLIAHWENFLLTECTGAEMLPGGLAHPVAMFHVPILGAGTSIGEMFELGQATSEFSIGIESYEWEFFSPLREEVTYQVGGRIKGVERKQADSGAVFDRIEFEFDIRQGETDIARSTVIWHYDRGRHE